ncbi:WhiB family transcriptional regulator [Luteococcus sp. H154]|uniref:WhiB family transcriptional regulator n=1 Tax=unclassified Luteococcus TaxID=2639923 RepID=UPI00313D9311
MTSIDVVISAPSSPAACSDADPNLFFADDMATVEQAKQICATCPVRGLCLNGALERAEPHGVWGGELFDGGRVIARKRPRGRPRKHPLVETPDADAEARAA